MTTPQDHLPKKSAAQVEADGDTEVELEWEGHTYKIPASFEDLDIDVIRAFEKRHAIAVVEGVFGSEQFALLERRTRAKNGGKFPSRLLAPLSDAIAKLQGLDNSGN